MTWRPSPGEVERLFALQSETALFERLVAALARRLLLPGEGAVDGGAHFGVHTLPLARLVGPAGWLLAVEPLPRLAQRLRLLLGPRTGLPQVEVAAVALAAYEGEATFHHIAEGPHLSAYSGLRRRELPVAEPRVELLRVDCRTLDGLLAGRERLGFIKLDLEGGEFDALRGGRESLLRHRPAVVFECGRRNAAALYGYDQQDYFGFFEAAGYRLLDIFGQPFGPADWSRPGVPYYRVAVPRGSGAEARVLADLPGLARAALAGDSRRRGLC